MSRKKSPADGTSKGPQRKRARLDPDKAVPPHATAESPDDKTDAPVSNEDTTAAEHVDQDPDTSHASAPDPDLHKTKTSEATASDLENETDAPTASQDKIPEEPMIQEPDTSNSCAPEPDPDETAVSQASTSRADNGTETPMSNQDKASEVPGGLLDLTGVDLARDLRSITKHLLHGEFLLFCCLRNGRSGWVPEERVQAEDEFTLNTFWESREDVPGRPHNRVCKKVFRIISQKPKAEAKGEDEEDCVVQQVGDPRFKLDREMKSYLSELKRVHKAKFRSPKGMTLARARELYPHAQHVYWKMTASGEPKPVPVMIFSHRKSDKDKEVEFEFCILYDSCKRKWISEVNIQKKYPAAVETYWQSHPGLREEESDEEPKVPKQCFKILSHMSEEGKTSLKVQLVGKSDLEKDIMVLEASESRTLWKKPTQRYLKKHKLQI